MRDTILAIMITVISLSPSVLPAEPVSGTGGGQAGDPRGGDCLACHPERSLLGEFAAHRKLSCGSCHVSRTKACDHDFTVPGISDCIGCHPEDDLGRSHPVGSAIRDPRTGKEMTCVSTCHTEHRSAGTEMLRSGKGDLCRYCHPDKY